MEFIRDWIGIPAFVAGLVIFIGTFIYVRDLRTSFKEHQGQHDQLVVELGELKTAVAVERQRSTAIELRFWQDELDEHIQDCQSRDSSWQVNPVTFACHNDEKNLVDRFDEPFPKPTAVQ